MPGPALRDWFPWGLAVLVFLSRALVTASAPYWADGPAHVEAARSGRYLIQPPGYWLFNRVAALFPTPQAGIEMMNWMFSAGGCVALYVAARLLVDTATARLAALAYASIYFTWFAGGVHSTYPAELLFPPLLFVCLVAHHRSRDSRWLWGAALSFALAAGFRPSDGVFVGLMLLAYLLLDVPRRQAAFVVALTSALCLVWLVPTLLGFQGQSALSYTTDLTSIVSPVFSGLNYRSLANIVRFVLPLLTAFWLLLPFMARTWQYRREREVQLLWLWIAPGALFLVLIYMSNAQYTTFMTGAVILLSVIALARSRPGTARVVLSAVIVWNTTLFLLFRPIESTNIILHVVNSYVGQDTLDALRHRRFQNLSDVVDRAQPFQKQ